MKDKHRQGPFDWFAIHAGEWFGHSVPVALSVGIVLLWLLRGFQIGWAKEHAELISIIADATSLFMLFIIQANAAREDKALNLKLDAVLKALSRDPHRSRYKEFIGSEEWNTRAKDEAKRELRG